jgi:hypothetical protein
MSGPKRTLRDRPRKATSLNDPVTVALFRELEKTPENRRGTAAYKSKSDDLAWRVGLHPESWIDAMRVDDATLIDRRPRYECFVDTWKRVTDTRAMLLELAGLPPDPPLFWCRNCGMHNHNPNAVRARQCVRCHEIDRA